MSPASESWTGTKLVVKNTERDLWPDSPLMTQPYFYFLNPYVGHRKATKSVEPIKQLQAEASLEAGKNEATVSFVQKFY